MFIDTHTHLDAGQFSGDIDNVIQEALDAKVRIMMMPNVDETTVEGMMAIHETWPDHCLPMIGIHPTSVKKNYQAQLDFVRDEAATGKYYAIGEIGIDLYWDTSLRKEQEHCFREQIALAGALGLPINIHSRESIDLCIGHVEEMKSIFPNLTGIFHCFTGSLEQARRIRRIDGFLMGIGGVITFKNSNLREVIRQVPIEALVLETDAPYLTPHPYRGKRNAPGYIPLIAAEIAKSHNVSIEKVEEITTYNAINLYQIPKELLPE